MSSLPVPVFVYYLQQLEHLLARIEEQSNYKNGILYARLDTSQDESMFPLVQQARTAISFSLRACCPLAELETVNFAQSEVTFTAVKQEIRDSIEFLEQIPLHRFQDYEQRSITTTAGFAELEMKGEEFLQMYALPNFFFHITMVYAIARQRGITLGKGDFDGLHRYPPGFTF